MGSWSCEKDLSLMIQDLKMHFVLLTTLCLQISFFGAIGALIPICKIVSCLRPKFYCSHPKILFAIDSIETCIQKLQTELMTNSADPV